MAHTNGSGASFSNPLAHYAADVSDLNEAAAHSNSTSSAVFPGFQNYTNLYPQYEDSNEPVNLSSTSAIRSEPHSQPPPPPLFKHNPSHSSSHSPSQMVEKKVSKQTHAAISHTAATSHTAALQLGRYDSSAMASQSHVRIPAVVSQGSPAMRHQIQVEALAQLSAPTTVTQVSSSPLPAYHRPLYNQNPMPIGQHTKPHMSSAEYHTFNVPPKKLHKRARMSKASGEMNYVPAHHIINTDSPVKQEADNSTVTSDPNSAAPLAKVPIQPLKRPAPLPAPAKKLPKSKPVIANSYQLILPLPMTTQGSNNSSAVSTSHLASSSPAIQAALNQPVVDRKRPNKKISQSGDAVSAITASAHIPALQQAPTMMHYLSQPPLHTPPPHHLVSSKAAKSVRRKSHKHRDGVPSQFQKVKSHKPRMAEERFVMASQIAGTPLIGSHVSSTPAFVSDQFAVVPSPRTAMMASHSPSNDNQLIIPGKSNGVLKEPAAPYLMPNEVDKFAPVDLRRVNAGFVPVSVALDLPQAPRSVLEMRHYYKQKGLLLRGSSSQEKSSEMQANSDETMPAQPNTTAQSQANSSSVTPNVSSPPTFDWISYLRATDSKATAQSAFKHLEKSLVNGFQIGMKVETPLRCIDTDKYWLATVVAVYGGVLKLRFDGYGDRSQDFTVSCSSGQLHPIGWCSKNQKSLLPPADIRHTQKQWKNFLLNVLQGAKTVPTYLLNSRGCPWVADRIKQGMRLEVQHENLPTAVWVAKVIRNVGGRMKLRYEGSIDDATDFWLFYLDRRAHPCGWSVTPQKKYVIYKPPEEIKESYEYEAWSNILQEVTRDSNIDRIPNEIFQTYPEVPAHNLQVGQLLEAVHPSGAYIGPARISSIINPQYFLVEQINSEPTKGVVRCYYSQEPTLFPVGWCAKKGVSLGKPPAQNNNEAGNGFCWTKYIADTGAIAADSSQFCSQVSIHQFGVGQKLEAVNPSKESQICVATITSVVDRLLWLEIYTTPTTTTTIIVDTTSQSIFPAGWCESNSYPLTMPLLPSLPFSQSIANNEAAIQHGELGPKIYFNHSCFSGPFLSKSRILELPSSVGPGHIRLIVKEMLSLLLTVGYRSSYILRILQRSSSPNSHLHTQVIKTKCKGKSYEGAVEVCTKRNELRSYCRQICRRLQCCPNLVSPDKVNGRCNERCETRTKTQYLSMGSRKPGRPSTTNPDGSKRRKRRKRKKVFTPRRNLYIPNNEYAGAISDNASVTSNSDNDSYLSTMDTGGIELPCAGSRSSPSLKRSPTPHGRLPSTPSSRPSSAADEMRGSLPKDHPLYQLQLTSVKKDVAPANPSEPVDESHHYQIVKEKKKKRRVSKAISPETLQRTKSLPISPTKRYPTVPPLKIRRLEMSPSVSAGTNELTMPSLTSLRSPTPTTSQSNIIQFTTISSGSFSTPGAALPLQSTAQSKPDLLLKAAVPHRLTKSALSFTQPRLHIESMERVELSDNPLYWDVDRLLSFIKQTDCAALIDKLLDHEMDGQAFMMLVLPTAQEELGLKLGPALKLCHHVQRLKMAFYETFHPEEENKLMAGV